MMPEQIKNYRNVTKHMMSSCLCLACEREATIIRR
jgi:hypothetical protein